MEKPNGSLDKIVDLIESEEGDAYAYGGGSLVAIVLIVLLLIWLL